MHYTHRIRDLMNRTGGIITSKELRESRIPTTYLTRMVNSGELIRVDRGIYINSKGDYDEYFFFHKRYDVAVFSYVSALYLHQFTDVIPDKMEVTVYKGYNPHRIKERTKVHFVSRDILDLGVTEGSTVFGNHVKVYDLERTICDLVKNRSDIEAELFSKTINRYVRYGNKDLNKLYEYAEKMGFVDTVSDILDVVYV